jgi:hypothetical protein
MHESNINILGSTRNSMQRETTQPATTAMFSTQNSSRNLGDHPIARYRESLPTSLHESSPFQTPEATARNKTMERATAVYEANASSLAPLVAMAGGSPPSLANLRSCKRGRDAAVVKDSGNSVKVGELLQSHPDTHAIQ